MDQGLPTIEDMAKRLIAVGAITSLDLAEFKRLELASLASARKEDALMLFSRLPDEDLAKKAMVAGLAELRVWMRSRIASATKSAPPKLYFVSGVPGAGKSVMLKRIEEESPGILVASADDFKERFKECSDVFLGETPEPARANLTNSGYIHRLTALPSWEMVDEAIDARVDLAVEMLGMGAVEDARTLRRALAKGYRVEVRHVGCSVEVALARAAKRHFEQKARGEGGRWIGLTQSASKQRAIMSSFARLCELMKGSGVAMRLYDNSELRMELAWRSEDGAYPPVENFATWTHDHMLWRPGANPAADLCVFHVAGTRLMVALVERANEPCAGQWAFPGGFVNSAAEDGAFEWGAEKAKEAALRRFAEETLSHDAPADVKFVGKFDALERDPRNSESRWVEEWLFCAKLDRLDELAAGDAVRSAAWIDVQDALSGRVPLAFDHQDLLRSALRTAGLAEFGDEPAWLAGSTSLAFGSGKCQTATK